MSRRRLLTTARATLAALGALFIIVTFTPITLWWGNALAGPWTDSDGDILIVLGADEPTAGILGQGSYWRTVYAVRAWESGHFRQIILSGGNNVAESMKQLLMCRGLPPSAIRLEAKSTSTRENALFTRELLSPDEAKGRIVLLTSDYHMFRAKRAFEKTGLSVVPRPLPDALKNGNYLRHRWPVFIELLVETVKLSGYFVRGWV